MIKCYHVRRIEMCAELPNKPEQPQLFFQGPLIAPHVATIDKDEWSLEEIWDCCNNSCWWDEEDYKQMKDYQGQFAVEFTDKYMGYCNDDLIIEMKGKLHVAKDYGWEECNTFEEALGYVEEHGDWMQIQEKNYQHPEGRELTMDEINKIKKEYEAKGYKCRMKRN